MCGSGLGGARSGVVRLGDDLPPKVSLDGAPGWTVWAQVAERLMAADCKSATHSSYGGSNPPLCTIKGISGQGSVIRVSGMAEAGSPLEKKYWVALVLYAVLAVLSWFTLDGKISVGGRLVELRLVPLVIIGG